MTKHSFSVKQLRRVSHGIYCTVGAAECECPTYGELLAAAEEGLAEVKSNWKPAPWGSTQAADIAYYENWIETIRKECNE